MTGFRSFDRFALGRLPAGKMNKTEAAYSAFLDLRKRAGEVAWYRFEGIKLRLADSTFLTIDFPVMLADGSLEMHDVKALRTIVRMRKQDAGERAEQETILETYMHALGMLA